MRSSCILRCPIIQCSSQEVCSFVHSFQFQARTIINFITENTLHSQQQVKTLIACIEVQSQCYFRERTAAIFTIVIRDLSVVIGIFETDIPWFCIRLDQVTVFHIRIDFRLVLKNTFCRNQPETTDRISGQCSGCRNIRTVCSTLDHPIDSTHCNHFILHRISCKRYAIGKIF